MRLVVHQNGDRRGRPGTCEPVPGTASAADVLPCTHVSKTSRDQFERRTRQRLMDIVDPTDKTVDALMKLDLPAGVDVDIELRSLLL